MQKTLLHQFSTLFLAGAVLVACGQKGSLYLDDKIRQPKQQGVFVPRQTPSVSTSLVMLESFNIAGQSQTFNPTHQRGWGTLLKPSADETNLLRYLVFSGDVLSESNSISALIGSVQNEQVIASETQLLSAGRYLRIKSSSGHVSTILTEAKKYLRNHPKIKRQSTGDFMIQSPAKIELYLAVQETE